MKSKTKWLLWGLVAVALCADVMLTPTGALRLKIALSGHPVKAITVKPMQQDYPQDLAENQIGYALKNPPFEADTRSELVNWVVTQNGIYYTAAYYGYG